MSEIDQNMTQLTQNEWQNGELECFNDLGNCKLLLYQQKSNNAVILAYQDKINWCENNFIILNIGCYGYCCAPCMICSNASGLEENGGLYCLLACCCPIVGVFLLRQKAREKYGIEVNMIKTCINECWISISFAIQCTLWFKSFFSSTFRVIWWMIFFVLVVVEHVSIARLLLK